MYYYILNNNECSHYCSRIHTPTGSPDVPYSSGSALSRTVLVLAFLLVIFGFIWIFCVPFVKHVVDGGNDNDAPSDSGFQSGGPGIGHASIDYCFLPCGYDLFGKPVDDDGEPGV